MSKQSQSEKLFRKYEHVALEYARKIFNNDRLAMTQDDIMQEFRIKLYEVILAYGRSIERFNETGIKQPIPLQFYIRSSMNNFKKDFIKSIESDKSKVLYMKNDETHDYSSYGNDMINLDFYNGKLQINGFDLLQNLHKFEKIVFCKYCAGVELDKLIQTYGSVIDVQKVISDHVKFLSERKHLFVIDNKVEVFVTNYVED